MKILGQINYLEGLGADRWIVEGFQAAFEELGHEFFFLTVFDDLTEKLQEVQPDIVMLGMNRLTSKNLSGLHEARRRGTKVVVRVGSFFREEDPKNIITKEDVVDLYYGETEDPYMEDFKKETGKEYHIITNAAHHKRHFPVESVEKYKCDIVFLGAMMPNKRKALEMLLLPLKKKYNVKIYGPNWTLQDNMLRALAKASRKLGLKNLNTWISNMRISVPTEDENKLYSSAKICLNIHERAEHIKSHVILNERTFKIPACGGFEICDFVPPLRKYFTEEEMVMADDKNGDWVKDWFEKIDYYLKHDEERLTIQKRGTEKALKNHTYINRVGQILLLLEMR